MGAKVLLDDVNVDTISDNFESRGGPAVVNVRADNFGGGSVLVQQASKNDPSLKFVTLPNGSFTADNTVKLDYLPSGAVIRAQLAGSTGASNVFVDILQ